MTRGYELISKSNFHQLRMHQKEQEKKKLLEDTKRRVSNQRAIDLNFLEGLDE